MTQSLRRYLSNRGSALFMVVSTMTALMIACMAMYFSVVSSRSTQYATFFREQSYQSAISLNDMVLAGLMDGSLTSSPDLLTQLTSMEVGDTITTGANGFTSFDSSQTGGDVEQMGAYSMDITRLPNEVVNGADNMTFDIATTTINNGVSDTVHTYIHIQLSSEEIPNGDKIFAATGYVPNEAYLDSGVFLTDVFLDTQYSYVSMYGSANIFGGDLHAGGTVTFGDNQLKSTMDGATMAGDGGDLKIEGRFFPVTWAIRDTVNTNWSGTFKYKTGSKVYVGGDFNFNNGGGIQVVKSNNTNDGTLDTTGSMDVYILGDLNLSGSVNFSGVNLYVYGNINGGQITGNPHVYVNGSNTTSDHYFTQAKWDSSAPGMSYEEAKRELNRQTYTKTYKKWIINDGDVTKGLDSSKSDYIKELDTASSSYNDFDIILNCTAGTTSGYPAMKTTYTIAYPGSDSDDGTADMVCTAGVINSVKGDFSYSTKPPAIVIDTGNDPNKVMTLRVQGYLDKNGNYGGNVFKWFPKCNTTCCTVIVKGQGSLVIDIPENVVYQDTDKMQFMHYGFFTMLGGEEGDWSGAVQSMDGSWVGEVVTTHYYDSLPIQSNKAVVAAGFVHTNCNKDDDCSYSTYEYEKYNYKEKKMEKVECAKHPGTYKLAVKCSVHNQTSISPFCPKCDTVTNDKVEKLKNGTQDEGVCNNRLGFKEIQKYLSDHSEISVSSNNFPHTNIFLVSSSESADIRFSTDLNGAGIMQNGFYGYVYAPFMTFKAKGGSGKGSNRFFGGLTCSDFIIDDNYAFTACFPTRMPEDLMGESSDDNLDGLTDKSWKISLGGY